MKNKDCIRIAHIVGKWVGGGVEAVVMNYYRYIDKSRFQFDFICDSDSTNIPYDEIKELGGKVILIPPYQKVFEYQKELKKVLKEGNYKIVHSHINSLSVFPLHAAKKVGVPIRIAHSHSTTNKAEWKRNMLKQVLKRFSKVYANRFMCCTEHAGRWLFGDKTFDEGKVYVLNNAIDLEKFAYDEAARKKIRKEIKVDDDTVVIGHIGRFMKQKNHEFIIDIFNEYHKKNNKSLLMLVGQGPLMDEMKEKAESLGIKDSVRFLGQRKDANETYQAMDFFLFPSLYEGLGMTVIEAQCSGLPCVASTEVPSIAKVTDLLKFLDLTDDVNEWVKVIEEELKNNKRENKIDEVSKYGYNIKEEVKKLEDKYMSYYKEI